MEITGSVDDPKATVTATINGGPATSAAMNGTGFSATLNLVSGLNTIDIIATDPAGNSTSAKRSITSDSTAPTLAVNIPAQDLATTQESIIISGTVKDAVASATISITTDGRTYVPVVAADGGFSQTISLTADKTYSIVVTAIGQAGNPVVTQRNIIKISAVSLGDITEDGRVDISDALKVLRIAVGLESATADSYMKADVAPLKEGKPSPDGMIDVGDALVILQKAVGLIGW